MNSMDRVSRVHRKKPRGKAMYRRASGAKRSTVRARVELVFGRQKDQMGLFIRTPSASHAPKQRSHAPSSSTISTA